MTTPGFTTNDFAHVADLVGLGSQITACNDSGLHDKALAIVYQNIESTKAYIGMLSKGDYYPEIEKLHPVIPRT